MLANGQVAEQDHRVFVVVEGHPAPEPDEEDQRPEREQDRRPTEQPSRPARDPRPPGPSTSPRRAGRSGSRGMDVTVMGRSLRSAADLSRRHRAGSLRPAGCHRPSGSPSTSTDPPHRERRPDRLSELRIRRPRDAVLHPVWESLRDRDGSGSSGRRGDVRRGPGRVGPARGAVLDDPAAAPAGRPRRVPGRLCGRPDRAPRAGRGRGIPGGARRRRSARPGAGADLPLLGRRLRGHAAARARPDAGPGGAACRASRSGSRPRPSRDALP